MADYIQPDGILCWLNGDGTWAYSSLKSHWGAESWIDYGNYMLPTILVWGY